MAYMVKLSLLIVWGMMSQCANGATNSAISPPPQEKRILRYDGIKTYLEGLSDTELAVILSKGTLIQKSIGGACSKIEMDGVPIFVKMIPLNDIEGAPENRESTKNLFDLPTVYQYGVMSSGFNVWREVASHQRTTHWVLSGETSHFPLMYHHRILPCEKSVINEKDIAEKMLPWKEEKAIEARLRANHVASKHIVLFLEYIPYTLIEWLEKKSTHCDSLDKTIQMIHDNILTLVNFMNGKGMLHFDTHFNNILTDGERLYLTDFGLATASNFILSEEEKQFFKKHHNYDRSYGVTQLTDWILNYAFGPLAKKRSDGGIYLDSILKDYAFGKTPTTVPKELTPFLESILKRYATITLVMDLFLHNLRTNNNKRNIRYPFEEIETLWAKMF